MIDLHVHSTMSDGTYTPAGLAQLAKERGVEAFSVTDHDIITGTDEAAAEAKKLGVEFINGMEMTMDYRGRRIHVICLGFDRENPKFKAMYAKLREMKDGNMDAVIEHIRQKGADISREMIDKYVTSSFDRYAVMRCLVNYFGNNNIQYLWDNYVNPAIEAVGNNMEIPAEEALPIIREAGGVSSLAHFHKNIGLKTFEKSEHEDIIKQLMGWGLDGMERYYPNYTAENEAFAAYMIDKYNMIPTGGTDFHGGNRAIVEFGTGIEGNMNVPYSFWERIMGTVKSR